MEDDNNDMYDNPSSSSYALQQPQFSNSDEFSLFVHQILQRSSSSPCPSATVGHTHTGATPTTQAAAGAFQSTTTTAGGGAVDCFGGYSGCVSASAAAILSSSSVGGLSEYETDENDCQSKESSEGLTDEMQGKPGSHRGSSKRTRAAEVHNLSEKRRRSRINEKMKALQNLIPNSNKTDKASMLDEAIEYLKQLQLQVQMLYMRNGLSLHSMCLPGVLQPLDISQMRMGLGEENQSLLFQTTVTPPLENPRQNVLGLRNNASLDQPSVPTVRNMVPESLFRPESSSRNNLGPLQLHASAEGVCREDVFCHQPNINQSATHPLGFDRTMTMGNFPSSAPAPDDNITTSMEACFLGRSQSDGVLLDGIQHNDISQHFSRAYPTISRNTSSNGIKAEGRREF